MTSDAVDTQKEWYRSFWQLFVYVSMGTAVSGIWLLWKVVQAQNRINQGSLLTSLHNAYSTPEMYDAIHTVVNWNALDTADTHTQQKHRRMVLQFWELLGTLVRFNLIDERIARDRFRDQVSIWEKLKPIHIRTQEHIVRERHPALNPSEVVDLATRDVEASAAHWLYSRWRHSRRPSWQSQIGSSL